MSVSSPDGLPTVIDHLADLYGDHIPPQSKKLFLSILDALSILSQEHGPAPGSVLSAVRSIDKLLDWWRPLPDQQHKARKALLRACEVKLAKEQRVRGQPEPSKVDL